MARIARKWALKSCMALGATGRMRRMQDAVAWFTFYYLPGTDLKSSLQYGGSGSAYYSYEPQRDLLTQVRNYINGGVISQYDYANDAIGRRTEISRSGSTMRETRTDAYGYNDRNELISAGRVALVAPGRGALVATDTLVVPGRVALVATAPEYAYSYDDIGNRLSSLDLGEVREYTANNLNQYVNVAEGVGDFIPQFDLDGNQTLVKTSTGIWSVSYNEENRPVLWECGSTNITMKFDRMGRRVEYVEMVSGVTNTHHRFVYDGYLCIQRLNAAANNSIDLVFGWDPSEAIATRPLILQKYGQYNLFYTHDGNKNVSELVFFQQANGIAAHYEYAPFGAVTVATRDASATNCDFRTYNPFRFSSEYADDALGLVYYNYRHYDSLHGRWFQRDRMQEKWFMNLYVLLANQPTARFDSLGDAPQYVYDGVSLTYESGVMRIWTSPDWDSGDFDYYYGRPYRPHINSESYDGDAIMDVIGICDPTPISDAIHAITYVFRGDAGNACVCLCSCLPFGDTAKLGNMVSRERRKLFFEGLVRHRRTMLDQWRSKYKEILANPQGESFII